MNYEAKQAAQSIRRQLAATEWMKDRTRSSQADVDRGREELQKYLDAWKELMKK